MEDIDSDIKICGACDYFGFYNRHISRPKVCISHFP